MSSLPVTNPLPVIDHPQLLEAVYNHKSLVPLTVSTLDGDDEGGDSIIDNERLAYLGDQVLQMSVTDAIFRRFPSDSTGQLNHKRTLCIKKSQVAKWSELYDLPSKIRAPTHQQATIRHSQFRQAQVLQAYLAVVFLTKDYDTVKKWVKTLVIESWDDILATEAEDLAKELEGMKVGGRSSRTNSASSLHTPSNSPPRASPTVPIIPGPISSQSNLSILHEMLTMLKYGAPEWTETVKGPPHQRTFTMAIKIKERDDIQAEGTGKTKSEAKQIAAGKAVELLNA